MSDDGFMADTYRTLLVLSPRAVAGLFSSEIRADETAFRLTIDGVSILIATDERSR